MSAGSEEDITALLAAWGNGDSAALSHIISVIYPELRRLARLHLTQQTDQTLESAAVANEAYLKLLRAHRIQCESRAHFLALCAQVTRQVIADYARGVHSAKRGGDAVRVPLDEFEPANPIVESRLLALHEALTTFSKMDPRKSRVVELRFFGGLTVNEVAEVLNVSPETVTRDWRFAKAWLLRELSGSTPLLRTSSDGSGAAAPSNGN